MSEPTTPTPCPACGDEDASGWHHVVRCARCGEHPIVVWCPAARRHLPPTEPGWAHRYGKDAQNLGQHAWLCSDACLQAWATTHTTLRVYE